jgi:hypothetical protein
MSPLVPLLDTFIRPPAVQLLSFVQFVRASATSRPLAVSEPGRLVGTILREASRKIAGRSLGLSPAAVLHRSFASSPISR